MTNKRCNELFMVGNVTFECEKIRNHEQHHQESGIDGTLTWLIMWGNKDPQ